MVLAERVGKERSFLRGFLLSIATVGLYSIYWNYKAHSEVYRQFELVRENRDEGVMWYLLGLIFPPLVFAYLWTFASNVAYVRRRLLLPARPTPGSFVALVGAAVGAFVAAWIAIVVAILGTDVETGVSSATAEVAAGLAFAFLFAMVAFAAVAYRRLQRAINEVWRAYDARVATLTARPPRGPWVQAPPLGPHPTTWVDPQAP